ncbi:hypothetical protein QZH41_018377, partial [Actinostola sp. cb2023]
VPNADCDGFGDINSYKTANDITAVMKQCDEKKSLCKAFAFNPNHVTPRYVFTKQSFGLPQVSSFNFYIKKTFLDSYLKILSVNLKCALTNLTVKHDRRCNIPVLDPWAKDIVYLVPTLPPRKCNESQLYTELKNNVLRLRDKGNNSDFLFALAEPILRGISDNSYKLGEPRELTLQNSSFRINSDLWRVTTILKDNTQLKTYHLSVVENPEVLLRKSSEDAPLDVYIITFDGTSEAHFRRMLPKSYAFLKDDLKSYMFKGYATVGDATLPNVNALLSGNTVEENKRMEIIDDWPLLFKDFKNSGFATLWSEDYAFIGKCLDQRAMLYVLNVEYLTIIPRSG